MDGLSITPLKQILHPKGDVLHGLRASEQSYKSFGEAYFSTIERGSIKGWKRHQEMTMNLIVPIGEIKLVFFDDRSNSSSQGDFRTVVLSRQNYNRVTVSPHIWFAFQGLADTNILLNIANIEHSPDEAETREIKDIPYDW